jgi:hypothetical protein
MDRRRLVLGGVSLVLGAYLVSQPVRLYATGAWRFEGLGALVPAVTLVLGVAVAVRGVAWLLAGVRAE